MADQRMTWDHDADKDLLGCMTDELVPTQPQLRGVMERMHSLGHTCTLKAITQHLQKLRKKEGGDGATAGATTPKPAATPKTPRKRAPPKPRNGSKTPASKGKRKASEAVGTDDGNDTDQSPAPSVKKVKGESAAEDDMDQFVKFQVDDDDSGAV
ncbi:hypothetical protein CONLIGDRAFT_431300 [Coniochaeta ligniaria NRRL 30616]|uniref:Uncharacterized protein n=1 Tax=Coniochaeta ligniaria NRRL 30616 TaxID=1408157 RepID=A0A1J7J2C0_9PEZI|nr:hypothetical protein CONLIGDRAFT_431300 [Coniochaeta ligniaria NRRL 30616]